jgi:ABC-type phosphate transport system substrate-binding protein
VAVLLISQACLARDIAVIAHAGNSSSGVSSTDLQKLIKTDSSKWPDGKKVTIFLSNPGSGDGKLVLQRLYKLSPEEIKPFVDSHKSSIMVLGSDELVLNAVANNPGAIGVVNVYSITSAVKVLKIDGKLPLEQGYLFHGN